jgi:hypothetical protein
MNMTRFVVEQSANVGITLTRSFLVEVPDDCTQEEAEKRSLEIDQIVLNDKQVEWINDSLCEWDEVDAQGTTLTPLSSNDRVHGLPTITLDNEE